jgi:hypothetical protein
MMPERFWRCVVCETVLRLSVPDDTDAGGPLSPLWAAAVRADQADFLDAHRAHLIELLVQTTSVVVTSGPLWDPATTIWWEVSNATRRFVIEGRREVPALATAATLDQPMTYRCIPGCLQPGATTIGIAEEEVAAAIDAALFPHVLPHAKLGALTAAATASLRALDAARLEVVHVEPTDPSVHMARLPADVLERMIGGLRPLLARWEHDRVAARLRSLHAADGLLLTVCTRYEIAPGG